MDDAGIVELLLRRDEAGIFHIDRKYGRYCRQIALNILANQEDAEECVNDTYLTAWRMIPPNRPSVLSGFLGRITRNIAIDRWRSKCADKRGGGEISLTLDELDYCLSGIQNVEDQVIQKELEDVYIRFLNELPVHERRVFLCRYWHFESVSDISERFGFSQSKTKSILFRVRNKLRKCFMKEGLL